MDRRTRSSEEDENLFPIYSERSLQDMSAMVSALTQVIGGGTTNNNPLQMHEQALTTSHSSSTQNEPFQQPQQDQGKCLTQQLCRFLVYITLFLGQVLDKNVRFGPMSQFPISPIKDVS